MLCIIYTYIMYITFCVFINMSFHVWNDYTWKDYPKAIYVGYLKRGFRVLPIPNFANIKNSNNMTTNSWGIARLKRHKVFPELIINSTCSVHTHWTFLILIPRTATFLGQDQNWLVASMAWRAQTWDFHTNIVEWTNWMSEDNRVIRGARMASFSIIGHQTLNWEWKCYKAK
jgi:hypothetical protein